MNARDPGDRKVTSARDLTIHVLIRSSCNADFVKGTLQQYVGRLHRLHDNKSEVHVYDYADVMVPMLARMYKKRLAGYSALGYYGCEVVRN